MKRLVTAIAACLGLLVVPAPTASALATPENEWLTTIGNYCFPSTLDPDGQTCRTKMVTRTGFFALQDYTIYVTGALNGPTGPVSAIPKYGSWNNQPPVTDYAGLSFNVDIYSNAFESLPAGDYQYTLNVDFPGQWHCSKFNSNGCSWVGDETYNYTYAFTWDGATTVTVAPKWTATVTSVKVAQDLLVGQTVDLYYQANAPRETGILIQRRQGSGPWKTVKKSVIPAYDLIKGPPFVYDKVKGLKPGTYSYRLVFKTTGGDTTTNVRKVRIR